MSKLWSIVKEYHLLPVVGIAIFVALVIVAWSRISERKIGDTGLSLLDLPKGATFVEHHHPKQNEPDGGEQKNEMDHYATPEAQRAGGPIYGVFGFSIVSIEYQIRESQVGSHMVGKDFPGWGLAQSILGTRIVPPYDHFHIGIVDEVSDGHDHAHEREYIIHYMLLPHEDELALGLSCG